MEADAVLQPDTAAVHLAAVLQARTAAPVQTLALSLVANAVKVISPVLVGGIAAHRVLAIPMVGSVARQDFIAQQGMCVCL
jgi:hypothetical protein